MATDPTMAGGAAPMSGADPMGGGMGTGAADPTMAGGAAPTGGADPMAADPTMAGGATDPAASTPPEDIGADVDNNMVPDGIGEDDEDEQEDKNGELGPDDEVIDVDELTKAQDKNNDKLTGLSHKLSNLVKALDKFQTAIDNNDRKIDDLKHELEKRNPTDLERMNLRSLASYPYTQNPRDYWDKKMMGGHSNYEVRYDNAISTANEPKIYSINRSDVEDFNEDEIERSLDNKMKLEDFISF